MEILDSQAFTELVVLLWNIWNRSNLQAHYEKVPPTWLTIINAKNLQENFQAARVVTSMRQDNRIHGHQWKKPTGVVVAEPEMALDNIFVNIRWDNIFSRMLLERELNMPVELVGVLKDFAVISEIAEVVRLVTYADCLNFMIRFCIIGFQIGPDFQRIFDSNSVDSTSKELYCSSFSCGHRQT
ncbi:hypothetical protein V6N13_014306 [Hibiscus sabdariffa]